MYDVIIVGAGPGGSFAAKILAKAGFDIILIEKDPIPRDKPCAGWITPKVLQLLKLSTSKLECFQPMMGAVIWAPEKNELIPFVVRYSKPVSYGIRRIQFDTAITNDAKDAGAEVLDATYVTNVYRQKKAVFVQGKNNQEFKGRFVIGADGTHSIVAKDLWLRRKWKPSELVQAVVSETEIGDKGQDLTDYYGYPEVFLNMEANTYSWFFTKGTSLNIGLGLQMSRISPKINVKIMYKELLDNLNRINHLQGIQLAPIKAHTYAAFHGPYHYPTYDDRVLLVGDAGGFAINFTGEGIRTAIQTGKMAAETLIHALETETKDLGEYKLRWNRALRDEYLLGDIIQLISSPNYSELFKPLFIDEKRYRRLFFDLFFGRITPRQAVRRFLLYSPLLTFKLFQFGIRSLIKELMDLNV